MRVCVAQQLHAILFGTGERLFMAMDHSRRIVFHGAQTDETLALQSLATVGRRKPLKIRENTGLTLMFQNAAADPILKECGGASVGVVAFVVRGRPLAQDDANQIVRAQRKIPRLHARRDLVVRLRNEVLYGAGLRAVAIGLKRPDAEEDRCVPSDQDTRAPLCARGA